MSDDWPAAGTILAFRYRLVSRLEIGGMAEIWHAQDELLARPVALKLPTGLDRARTDVLQLAWKEARMGARLSHPNIAAVHDYDEAVRPEGSVAPFVVMELLSGETLAARLDRAPLPWREAAAVGAAVAGALTAAHGSGVVHRDVKPGNVMLTPTGVKILDFGISAVTGEPDDDETGATFGTPAYVAPERLDGRPAEPATDVYGLGVLLFEMVTGQPPYPVDTWEELGPARAGGTPGLPSTLPAGLRELVARCLADEPERRPTAAEVGDGLAELITLAEKDQAPPATVTTAHPGPAGVARTARAAGPAGAAWREPAAAPAPADWPFTGSGYGPREGPESTGGPGHGSSRDRPGDGRPGNGPGSDLSVYRPGSSLSRNGPGIDLSINRPGSASTRPGDGLASTGLARRAGGGVASGAGPGDRSGSRRHRLVLWSSLAALAVSLLALFAALSSTRPTVHAGPSPAAAPPPSSPAPSTAATAPATPTPAPTTPGTVPATPRTARTPAPLDVDVALARVRSAVEAGRDEGQIRADVAVDLLNLLRPLGRADAREADDLVAQLRRKLSERVDEGSVDAARAGVLRSRLNDLLAALSSG